eukprot:scaffold1469_cov119-Cylindrotheca_fusiformis.AAC.27
MNTATDNGETDTIKEDDEKLEQTVASSDPSPNVDDADQDSDASSIGVPLVMVSPNEEAPELPEKMEKPADGLEWDDSAILSCWNLAVETHEHERPKEWQAPSLLDRTDHEFLSSWKPKELPLPLWAVDPFSHA